MCDDEPPRPRPSDSSDSVIPVDPAVEAGTDDDIASIYPQSTVSLTESIMQYREIHGRTYTQRSEYWGPNDERQSEALDFNHFWITDFFEGKLFHAPIDDHPQRILDMGTGTGIWAIDMADQYPSAEVTGVDLSPIQPTWVPPNLKFQIDDFNQEWTWPKDHFDYIHGRNLEACFTDLPTTMKEAYNHTKPGGYIEFLEFESQARSQVAELPEEHIYRTCYTALITAANTLGKPGENVRTGALQRALEQAGYVDLVHHRWKIPIGGWCADPKLKQLGWTILDFLSDSLEGFGLYLLKEVAGFSYEKCQVMFSEYRAAMRDPRLQSFYYMHVIYARKPEVSKEKKPAPSAATPTRDTPPGV